MATMNVSIPDSMKHWVEAQAAKIAEVQRLVKEGLESGVGDQSMAVIS